MRPTCGALHQLDAAPLAAVIQFEDVGEGGEGGALTPRCPGRCLLLLLRLLLLLSLGLGASWVLHPLAASALFPAALAAGARRAAGAAPALCAAATSAVFAVPGASGVCGVSSASAVATCADWRRATCGACTWRCSRGVVAPSPSCLSLCPTLPFIGLLYFSSS